MSLPLQVIDRLFDRLTITYGREFMARYDGLDANAVKSSWGYELSGYSGNLEAIGFALEHLPARAPNVVQFKEICLLAPVKQELQLEGPKPDKARVAAEFAKLAPMREVRQSKNSLEERGAWARKILARKEAGEIISPTVLSMAREGLKNLGLEA